MARQKQSWRETASYCADAGRKEDEHERESPPKDKPPVMSLVRPQESYEHPVFKSISKANSFVNSMTEEDITKKLSELGLSTSGYSNVTTKRLKSWIKTARLREANVQLKDSGIDYLVVIDFEATCEEGNPAGFQQEIIEFPAVLVNVKRKEIEGEFHSYCKPMINKKLTKFCTSLTGITQDKVESAPLFSTVLKRFNSWLETMLKSEEHFVIVTDGPWDIARFLSNQCKMSKVDLPHYFQTWSNLRKHFRNYYKIYNKNLEGMLDALGMTFKGRPHCGLDDTRNIARIAIQLLADGCELFINETFG